MKCDELTPLVFSLNDLAYVDELAVEKNFENPHDHAVYKSTEVDEAIAELKEKLHDVDNQWNEQCKEIAELKARIAYLEKLNHDLCERVTENDEIRLHWEEIEQTRAENERLKAKLENVQASAYADSVDAGMRERRLRRALWLARALRARDIQRWWIAVTCAPITERACSVWNNVERKCLKKMEEYR